jgi:homoaconitase/3-isopropylmalate dehydratase large subunit
MIEALRAIPGIKQTDTRIVLKKHSDGHANGKDRQPIPAVTSGGSMGTLVEEIFSKKAGRTVKSGEIVLLDVDYIMSHDNTTPLAIKAFNEIGKPVRDVDKIVIHFDHAYPAPNVQAAENQKKARDFIRAQGVSHFYHQGVCHQVMIEEGFVTPGRVIVGGDSHTNTYGAFGAFATGLGSTEIGVAWATGKCWFRVPETLLVRLEGQTQPGVYAKDVMLAIAGIAGHGRRDLPLGGIQRRYDRPPANARTHHLRQHVNRDRR